MTVRDDVDRLIADWQRERPELDLAPMQVMSRISRLAVLLDRERREAFAAHDIAVWEFDVLAALRRAGESLSPGQLLRETLVTSGTMTNRIDRLAARGLVERSPDPSDRRGVRVRLTVNGRVRVDAALDALLEREQVLLADLSAEDSDRLADLRRHLPVTYVDVVPVRTEVDGSLAEVGLLLRASGAGQIVRSIVSGRVLIHETLREAIARHIEKDLGPMALPRIPLSPVPFTVAEYFPTPGVSPFHDPRQHAISLAYVVPIDGETAPQEDALELSWFGVDELLAESSPLEEMDGGRDLLVRRALAHIGAA